MNELNDFYRNVTYFKDYDENSFIGQWLDYSKWNDDEYWKLECSLLRIADIYNKTGFVSQDILLGIMRIVQVLMVPNWNDFSTSFNEQIDIYDRYERIKYILSMLFSGEEIKTHGFFYDIEI